MNQHSILRTAAVLILFAIVFVGLTVSSYRQLSATVDEPQHIVTGYSALTLKDYRVDPLHPPLLRIWSALPLLAMPEVRLSTNTVAWATVKPWLICEQFMYVDNDGDRLLNRARFMNVLWGVLLGVLLFGWGRQLMGFWPAVIVLGMYCFEPNILASFGLVTTDPGLICCFFGTAYFLWRTARQLSALNVTGLTVFFALAQAGKFTALILGPIVFVLLLFRAGSSEAWGACATSCRRFQLAGGIVLLLAITTFGLIWASYGFQYSPAPVGTGLDRVVSGPTIHQRVPNIAAVVDWIDEHRLLPNLYGQGFALGQGAAQFRTAFLLGQISDTGWWYYFPVAILIKTPVPLLVLFLAGLAVGAANRSKWGAEDFFILLPLLAYLGVAMAMKINIGLRHVLPIYPLALLIAGRAVAAVVASGRKFLVTGLAALCLLQVIDVVAIHPHYLAYFNFLIGGPRNGHKYLADSNIDWGQDLKGLKQWMDSNGVQRINLSYFGSADPAYYGINCIPLRGSPPFLVHQIREPSLPGLVAVSVQNLTGAGLDGDQFYKPLLEMQPIAIIGYSIHIYLVDKPWW